MRAVTDTARTFGTVLDRYFGRCFIETIFKSAKEYVKLLPLKE
jgi:hypothetical protein